MAMFTCEYPLISRTVVVRIGDSYVDSSVVHFPLVGLIGL